MYSSLTETCSDGLQIIIVAKKKHVKIKSGNLLRTPKSLATTTIIF